MFEQNYTSGYTLLSVLSLTFPTTILGVKKIYEKPQKIINNTVSVTDNNTTASMHSKYISRPIQKHDTRNERSKI